MTYLTSIPAPILPMSPEDLMLRSKPNVTKDGLAAKFRVDWDKTTW